MHISDNGTPALHSTTRVVVTVVDVNDNAPEFQETFYKMQVPALAGIQNDQNFQPIDIDENDEEGSSFQVYYSF